MTTQKGTMDYADVPFLPPFVAIPASGCTNAFTMQNFC